MNILFFTESGHGVGALLCDQISAIYQQNKNTIAVASSLEQQPGLIAGLQEQGIEVISMPGMENHLNFKEHVLLLRKSVVEKKIDVVHVQTNWQLVMTFFAFLGLKIKPKVIYTIHSFRNHKGRFEQNVTRILMSIILILFSDKVFATSEFLKNKFSILGSKIFILPLGIDQSYIDREYVEPQDGITMIFPARFREGKRQDMIIRALACYINETGDESIKLILPGDGAYLEECIILADQLGIKRNVNFPGLCSTTQLLDLYDRSNILVCSSVSETYCLSIVEGVSLGKCVLSTPVGIASEILDNKTTGFIFNTEDELEEYLKKIHFGKINHKQICKNNYNRRNLYSWYSISTKYLEVLND